jgi:hypothetical protein
MVINDVMLNVVMLSVILLIVVAPNFGRIFWLLFDTDDKSKGLAPIFLYDHVTIL